jgi:AcrR family transcriptional regulator
MTYHHGNLKEALLEAATELLAGYGPDGLSLRGVARRAGVSQSAPYRHFKDKEELLAAIGQNGFRRLKALAEERLLGAADHRERLHLVGAAYVEFAQRNPHLFRLMFGPMMRKEEEHPDLKLSCQECFGLLLAVIEAGQADGVFRAGDPEVLGTAAWSTVHGIAHLALDGQLPPRTEASFESVSKLLRAVGDLLIDGLKA